MLKVENKEARKMSMTLNYHRRNTFHMIEKIKSCKILDKIRNQLSLFKPVLLIIFEVTPTSDFPEKEFFNEKLNNS